MLFEIIRLIFLLHSTLGNLQGQNILTCFACILHSSLGNLWAQNILCSACCCFFCETFCVSLMMGN